MLEGRYYHNFPNWDKWVSPQLHLVFNARKFYNHFFRTCGSAAISVITGLSPTYIERFIPKPRLHWTDASIRRFLECKRYKMIPLTKNGVTSLPGSIYNLMPIRKDHCILVNGLVCKNEATYFVLYKGKVFHNFVYNNIDPLLLINKPSQSMYIIWKKR